jgi:hypothetical protein
MAAPETDDLKIKKYEELYKLSKEAYASEVQRFDASEVKVARYLSLIVVVLGTTGVGAAEFSRIFRQATDAVANAFLISYFLTVVLSTVSGGFFVRAVALQVVRLPPLGDELIAHFDRNNYLDAIYSLGREFQAAAEHLRGETRKKFEIAATGYTLFVGAVALAVISTVTYVVVKALEVK